MSRTLLSRVFLVSIFVAACGGCFRRKAPAGRYDVAAMSVTFLPDPARVGDNITFTYEILNTAATDIPAGTFGADFYVDGRRVTGRRTTGWLGSGLSKQYSRAPGHWHWTARRAGWHNYMLVVDEDNRLPESDEENNVLFGKFWVFDKEEVVSPVASSVPGYEQPSYAAWQQIEVGMTEEDVVKLLGPPVHKPARSSHPLAAWLWTYGTLLERSAHYPTPARFIVAFGDGKVINANDPFGGVFSVDGKPTTPVLHVPEDGAVLGYLPRFIDFRWSLSSGKYPMRYEIHVDVRHPTASRRMVIPTTMIPYAVVSFPGANEGRWRVRAINSLGKSEWTEFRYFDCRWRGGGIPGEKRPGNV